MMLQIDALLTKDDAKEAERWLAEQFALHGILEPLPGEHDRNFKVTATDGRRYLFKIHPPVDHPAAPGFPCRGCSSAAAARRSPSSPMQRVANGACG